jgi:hypothetical protein
MRLQFVSHKKGGERIEALKVILVCLLILVIILGLTWVAMGNEFFL